MESLPFKELIHALATTLQKQHQALVAVLQCATADPAGGLPGISEPAHISGYPSRPHFTLTKIGPHDDPETFLVLFEQALEVWGWPINYPDWRNAAYRAAATP